MNVLLVWLSGLGFALSLIVAVGAQNTFVLRQGLTASKRVLAAVVTVCAVSDVALMAAGVAGMGALIARIPALILIIRYLGAAFLVVYGVLAARRVMRAESLTVAQAADAPEQLGKILLVTAAFTFLNPGTYLDTVILVGGIANQHEQPWLWASGAMSASVLWFFALGFGARQLRPVFAKPITWRIFDSLVAVLMFVIAASLIWGH